MWIGSSEGPCPHKCLVLASNHSALPRSGHLCVVRGWCKNPWLWSQWSWCLCCPHLCFPTLQTPPVHLQRSLSSLGSPPLTCKLPPSPLPPNAHSIDNLYPKPSYLPFSVLRVSSHSSVAPSSTERGYVQWWALLEEQGLGPKDIRHRSHSSNGLNE